MYKIYDTKSKRFLSGIDFDEEAGTENLYHFTECKENAITYYDKEETENTKEMIERDEPDRIIKIVEL